MLFISIIICAYSKYVAIQPRGNKGGNIFNSISIPNPNPDN
jgi:hypothetical protein